MEERLSTSDRNKDWSGIQPFVETLSVQQILTLASVVYAGYEWEEARLDESDPSSRERFEIVDGLLSAVQRVLSESVTTNPAQASEIMHALGASSFSFELELFADLAPSFMALDPDFVRSSLLSAIQSGDDMVLEAASEALASIDDNVSGQAEMNPNM